MLSRRHIRAKVMQALYSYWNSGDGQSREQVQRNLDKNISNVYSLYLYLLVMVAELGKFVTRYDEEVKAKYLPAAEDMKKHLRFYNNGIIQKLLDSKTFKNKCEWNKVPETTDVDILRKIFYDLKNTERYKDYLLTSEGSIAEDGEIIIHIIKHYPQHFSLVEQHLEEEFFNWNDDKKLAIQMAVKTIKNIVANPDSSDFILPLSVNEEENDEFAKKLFRSTIEHESNLNEKIADKISKWEPGQISKVDLIILKMGLAEFLYFPTIPTKVTLNEYIELAKNYSAPNSKNFVNGVLDNLLKELKEKGLLEKSTRGLYDK